MTLRIEFGEGTDDDTVWNLFGSLRGFTLRANGRDGVLQDLVHAPDGGLFLVFQVFDEDLDFPYTTDETFRVDPYDAEILIY